MVIILFTFYLYIFIIYKDVFCFRNADFHSKLTISLYIIFFMLCMYVFNFVYVSM